MADDKRPPEFMSALVTEHFVLQSAASSTISESGSRVAIHLSALSSGPGRPIDFGRWQQERYRGRNVVELSFSKLKQWRGVAVRSDKTARNYNAALCLAATSSGSTPALATRPSPSMNTRVMR